jgi:hypothetical protein
MNSLEQTFFSNLLQGARKESIPGLVWLLRKLVFGNLGRHEDLTAFWILCGQ